MADKSPVSFDEKTVFGLPAPAAGAAVYYEQHKNPKQRVSGFGVRVTSNGTRSYILNYRTKTGRERRLTIGRAGEWTATAARDYARDMRQKIAMGEDPVDDERAAREAPTVKELCQRFLDYGKGRDGAWRPGTRNLYKGLIDNWILKLDEDGKGTAGGLGTMKVAEVKFDDINRLHTLITKSGAPYMANRALAVMSKMFNLAIRWEMRADNPVKGVERNQEHRRERFLTAKEAERLVATLGKYENKQAASVIMLLLLTGARRGEVFAARWEQFDLAAGTWTKPSSHTKQKRPHLVPISPPAMQLLLLLQDEAEARAKRSRRPISPFVFPSAKSKSGHVEEIKDDWAVVATKAKLTAHTRIHDLRHSFASFLASGGMSLPIIGKLLGHTQTATTARYAHLHIDPLRDAAARVGEILAIAPPTADGSARQ